MLPGGHGGFVDTSMGGEPEAFAHILRQTLYSKAEDKEWETS
jgi:hypothetical protein